MPRIVHYNGDVLIPDGLHVTIECCVCRQTVTPDALSIGRRHIYATHCGVKQAVGRVT